MHCAQVRLRYNKLGDEGWCAIFDALHDNPQNKIKEWDLAGQGINDTIVKSLAAYMAVSGSLTSLNLYKNKIGEKVRHSRPHTSRGDENLGHHKQRRMIMPVNALKLLLQ